MKEKTTEAYTLIDPRKLPTELDTNLTEEFIKEGFNHFVDKNMMLYTKIMEESSELDLTYSEPSRFKKAKDKYVGSKTPVKSGYARVHEFIVSLAEVADMTQEQAAIHMVNHGVMNMDGKGCSSESEYGAIQTEAANIDLKIRDELGVETEMEEVEPVDEEEVKNSRE